MIFRKILTLFYGLFIFIAFLAAQGPVNEIELSISRQSPESDTLLFYLVNNSSENVFAAPFNAMENRVEIYSPENKKLNFAFIACGDRSMYQQIEPGASFEWKYAVLADFFDHPFRREKLDPGLYKIKWIINTTASDEFIFDYKGGK